METVFPPDSKLRASVVAFAVVVYAFILSQVLVLPAVVIDPTLVSAPGAAGMGAVVLFMVLNFAGLAAGAATYLLLTGRSWSWLDLRWPTLRQGIVIVIGTLATLAFLLVVGLVSLGLEVEPTENVVVQFIGDDPTMVLVLIGIVFLFNAPAEEFLFRNVVQKRLYTAFTRTQAVVVTSAIFALVHIPSFLLLADGSLATPAQVLVPLAAIFGGSIVFGYAYARTDNLFVPIGIHAGYNAVQFGDLYLRLSGLA